MAVSLLKRQVSGRPLRFIRQDLAKFRFFGFLCASAHPITTAPAVFMTSKTKKAMVVYLTSWKANAMLFNPRNAQHIYVLLFTLTSANVYWQVQCSAGNNNLLTEFSNPFCHMKVINFTRRQYVIHMK